MRLPLCIVDAFADRPFTGNPAAVCLLEGAAVDPPVEWMQALGAEMNLSETAFVRPLPGRGPSRFALRWFTPTAEVELCGHATLASAHFLWETARAPRDEPVTFHTRFRGQLTCTLTTGVAFSAAMGSEPLIAMNFPADLATPAQAAPVLIAAVNLPATATVLATARSRYDWLLELDSPDAVRAAAPDFPALARACALDDTRGVALTAAGMPTGVGTPDAPDVISRFFAPRLRINEDPVTGSLHCALAPYWSPRLGKQTLRCHQASPRGGTVITTFDVASSSNRVTLAGRAVTILRGEVEAL